jgi:hypothetical protein
MKSRAEKTQEQVELAISLIKRNGYKVSAVVKECRLSQKSRKVTYGFHFEDGLNVGDRRQQADGSVYEVMAIVLP